MPARARSNRKTNHFPVSPNLRQPAQDLGPRATRTVAQILEATKSILLTRGYAGTTVDEIARVAGVSRASFYTYFPSKRDALLALGADSAHTGDHMIELAGEMRAPVALEDLERYVAECFAIFDTQASFSIAWTQAAHEDEEIRVAGMKRHLRMSNRLGRILGELRDRPFEQPTAVGLSLFSQVERAWSYCELYRNPTLKLEVQRAIAAGLAAQLS